MAYNNNDFTLIQSYPVFEPNQVLTDRQLNGIVNYLEQQDRLTRVCLLGMGIVCGLEATVTELESGELIIQISAGHGVTSEGYLVKIEPSLLTHYRLQSIPTAWFGLDADGDIPLNFTNVPDLITAPEFEEDDVFPLTQAELNGRVLVLVLECIKDDKDALCGNDCDEKGMELNFIVHKLLLTQTNADQVLECTYDPQGNFAGGIFNDLDELFYHRFFTTHPFIERFGFVEETDGDTQETTTAVRLNTIEDYDIFQERYRDILIRVCNRLDEGLVNVNKVFSPVFTPQLVTGTGLSLPADLKNDIIEGSFERLEVQYLYDYLCDLVHAYLEFLNLVYDLIADCPPDMHRFPQASLVAKIFRNWCTGNGPLYAVPYSIHPTRAL